MRAALLRWYRRGKRDLPWRRDVSPYRTWVSEIMLQQTTVAAVAPKYTAFVRRFPTVAALAAATEEEVLAAWAGLGYYSRARNLRRAAVEIMVRYGGRFPTDHESILALPGIGRYTAGAILSIAYDRPFPVVDGNVIRVFARLFGLRGRAKDSAFAARIWSKAGALMPKESPGDWNQALMELGATVCTPVSPNCPACPVTRHCAAFGEGTQGELPKPEPSRAPTPVRLTCLWITRGDEVLLWKRSERERLLKNLWGLPEVGQVPAKPGALLARTRHTITHHALNVELRAGKLHPGGTLQAEARWTPRALLRKSLVSSLWRKLLTAASARAPRLAKALRRAPPSPAPPSFGR